MPQFRVARQGRGRLLLVLLRERPTEIEDEDKDENGYGLGFGVTQSSFLRAELGGRDYSLAVRAVPGSDGSSMGLARRRAR